ncbi:hypothetical protein OIV83_005077 [Microbotryomycetes sp. JL201]|nr:hypothetical protein OIV83_005077 [Microbotryomycetes sp. JL201]
MSQLEPASTTEKGIIVAMNTLLAPAAPHSTGESFPEISLRDVEGPLAVVLQEAKAIESSRPRQVLRTALGWHITPFLASFECEERRGQWTVIPKRGLERDYYEGLRDLINCAEKLLAAQQAIGAVNLIREASQGANLTLAALAAYRFLLYHFCGGPSKPIVSARRQSRRAMHPVVSSMVTRKLSEAQLNLLHQLCKIKIHFRGVDSPPLGPNSIPDTTIRIPDSVNLVDALWLVHEGLVFCGAMKGVEPFLRCVMPWAHLRSWDGYDAYQQLHQSLTTQEASTSGDAKLLAAAHRAFVKGVLASFSAPSAQFSVTGQRNPLGSLWAKAKRPGDGLQSPLTECGHFAAIAARILHANKRKEADAGLPAALYGLCPRTLYESEDNTAFANSGALQKLLILLLLQGYITVAGHQSLVDQAVKHKFADGQDSFICQWEHYNWFDSFKEHLAHEDYHAFSLARHTPQTRKSRVKVFVPWK